MLRSMRNVLLAACLPLATLTAHAADPVKIGVAIPLSGPAAVYGADMRRGSDLAAQVINANGGILGGRKVELVYEDDKGTPAGGVAAVQKLMSMDRVKVITGGALSSVVLAETAVTKNKILHMNAGGQADAITEQGHPFLFAFNNTVSNNSRSFNRFIIEKLKPKSVAYMGENTEFNKATLEVLRNDLKAAGIQLLETATYDADTRDFTSILTRIKSLNADVLFVADAVPARAAQLWKQVRQVGGFRAEVMSPGVVSPATIKPAEGAMEGVYTGDIYANGVAEGADGKAFIEGFRKVYKADPGKAELVMYESVIVAAAGMNKAGSDSDYAKIATAIRGASWPSPRGSLRFDEKGRTVAPVFYIQQVKGADLKIVDTVRP